MATIIQEPDNGYARSLKDLIIEGDWHCQHNAIPQQSNHCVTLQYAFYH